MDLKKTLLNFLGFFVLIAGSFAAGYFTYARLHPTPVEAGGAYWLVWPQARARNGSLRLFRDWLALQAEPEDTLPR